MKHLIAVLCVLSLAACATQAKVTPNQKIAANAGILLTNLHCDNDTVLTASIYKTGTKMSFWTVPMTESEKILDCNKGYQTLALPEGQYFISSFVVSQNKVIFNQAGSRHLPENQTLRFSVQKQKINYIGDISLSAEGFTRDLDWYVLGTVKASVNSHVENKKAEANAFLQKDQSHLLKNYPLVTTLTKR